MSEQPGKYQRSVSGMVGAMVVLVLVVLAFVAFRSLVRDEPASTVRAVDYQEVAAFQADQVDFELAAPTELPAGWVATNAELVEGERPTWQMAMLTQDNRYVGLFQADREIDNMVEDHVDEQAVQGEDTVIDGEAWQTWTDEGGDIAIARRDGNTTTLVVGTQSADVLVAFVSLLE